MRPLLVLPLLLAAGGLEAQTGRTPSTALHGGLAWADVAAADFEVVRSLGGQDLFSETDAQDSRADAAIFVSHRLWSGGRGGVGAYATLGTGLTRPGSVLFLGGSVAVRRVLLTAGAATARVPRGADPVLDEVFRGAADRTLYARLEREREWGVFVALSFAVLP